MKLNKTGNIRKTMALLALAIALGASAHAAGMAEVPSPKDMAGIINGHLSMVESADTGALLDRISGADDFTATAMAGAMSSPEQFATLQSYLQADPAGQETAVALDQWFAAVQKNAGAKAQFAATYTVKQKMMKAKSAAQAATMETFWSGGVTGKSAEDNEGVEEGSGKKDAAAAHLMPQPKVQAAAKAKPKTEKLVKLDFGEETKKGASLSAEEKSNVAAYVDSLVDIDPNDAATVQKVHESARGFGAEAAQQVVEKYKMLDKSVRSISQDGGAGKAVAADLLELQKVTRALDASEISLDPGVLLRWLGRIPGIGRTAENFVAKSQSLQGVIENIEKNLEKGKENILKDNVALTEYAASMEALSIELGHTVAFAKEIQVELEARIEDPSIPEEKKNFLKTELLHPLIKRIEDLEGQRAVNSQGATGVRIIIKSNEELADDVDRTIQMAGPALRNSTLITVAIAGQKQLLTVKKAVKGMVNKQIENNAKLIKENVVEIGKEASAPIIDPEVLVRAQENLNAAIDSYNNHKLDALPAMKEAMARLDEANRKSEETLRKMANSVKPRQDILSQLDGKKKKKGGK